MAREFSKAFYHSKQWQQVREYVLMRDSYLCRICGQPAEEVHHKIHLTPENVTDINVCLNWDNLELLCRECHAEEHADDMEGGREAYREAHRKTHDRFKVDHLGRVTAK